MALSEQTISKHNINRATVFAAHGLGDHDVAYAHPAFTGYATDEAECCLCGQQHIKWLFAIKFDAPDAITAVGKVVTGLIRTDEVTLAHVGSKCINDWLDAIPESLAKFEALKKWHAEMNKCKAAMTAKVVEDLCAKAGYATPEDAYDAYCALPWSGPSYNNPFRQALKSALVYGKVKQLRNNARTVKHKQSSRGTVKSWLASLATAIKVAASLETKVPAPKAPETPAPAPQAAPKDDLAHLSVEDKALLLAARAVFTSKTDGDVWNAYERSAVVDIARKVKKYGSFATARQRDFFKKLLKLPAPKAEEKATATVAKPVLGDASFESASKVDGARY